MRPLLLTLALAATPLYAQQAAPGLDGLSQSFQVLADRVGTAVVQVITRGYAPEDSTGAAYIRAERGNGSGVVVDPDGLILTNAHVVGVARRVQVLIAQSREDRSRFHSIIKPVGKLVSAEVVGIDRETDLAVLRVAEKGLPHLKLADSDEVRQGQLAFAFGSPYGLDNSVSMGVVSSVARQIQPDDPMIYIQTDAAINPGNSGGPLVDTRGRVIGINTFIVSQSGSNAGVGFAVPSNIASTVFHQILKYGHVRRGQIGVIAQTITPLLAAALGLNRDWGVIISDVSPRSAAEAAGLRMKDIVLELDGRPMENARQMGVGIYQKAGETIELKVLRAGKEMSVKVAVLERPRDPDRIFSLVHGDTNFVTRLGIVAIDLDERVTPLLPPLRRLSGVVVAGTIGLRDIREGTFRPGDVIYEINGRRTATLDELKAAIAQLERGAPAAVLVERLGQIQFVELEVE